MIRRAAQGEPKGRKEAWRSFTLPHYAYVWFSFCLCVMVSSHELCILVCLITVVGGAGGSEAIGGIP